MQTKYIPLEILKIGDIRRWEKRKDDILDYFYKNYSFFQNARTKILPQLKTALTKHCETFSFKGWHRCISYKFSDNPLSARGSLLNDPGGRFNIGDIDSLKFPRFPALYIADNFEIAYRERNQMPSIADTAGLTADELALSTQESFTDLRIDGHIQMAMDLTKPNTLKDFFQCIKNIKLPKDLAREAKKLNIPPMPHVSSQADLKKTILTENWRVLPMQVDIPANSQIFGQILNESKIEAVIYPSRMRSKHNCMAIFIENFQNSDSEVCISDKTPAGVKINCLDASSWRELY